MEPTTYVITFRGEAGRAVSAAFDDLDVSTKEGLTTLRATVPDQAALHGVIERIRALGLELVAVQEAERLTTSDPPSSSWTPKGRFESQLVADTESGSRVRRPAPDSRRDP